MEELAALFTPLVFSEKKPTAVQFLNQDAKEKHTDSTLNKKGKATIRDTSVQSRGTAALERCHYITDSKDYPGCQTVINTRYIPRGITYATRHKMTSVGTILCKAVPGTSEGLHPK